MAMAPRTKHISYDIVVDSIITRTICGGDRLEISRATGSSLFVGIALEFSSAWQPSQRTSCSTPARSTRAGPSKVSLRCISSTPTSILHVSLPSMPTLPLALRVCVRVCVFVCVWACGWMRACRCMRAYERACAGMRTHTCVCVPPIRRVGSAACRHVNIECHGRWPRPVDRCQRRVVLPVDDPQARQRSPDVRTQLTRQPHPNRPRPCSTCAVMRTWMHGCAHAF